MAVFVGNESPLLVEVVEVLDVGLDVVVGGDDIEPKSPT